MSTTEQTSGQLPPICVLVVEDEGLIALDMKRTLERLGCRRVVTASDGSHAVSVAEELRPDVVVMDIGLPGDMDGFSAASVIHDRFGIPIVFASAYRSGGAFFALQSDIAASQLVKPFSVVDLQLSVKAALRQENVDSG
jgi:two-component system, sensor histidine kinase